MHSVGSCSLGPKHGSEDKTSSISFLLSGELLLPLFSSMMSSSSVSYTHLDVYKRQQLRLVRLFINSSLIQTTTQFAGEIVNQEITIRVD